MPELESLALKLFKKCIVEARKDPMCFIIFLLIYQCCKTSPKFYSYGTGPYRSPAFSRFRSSPYGPGVACFHLRQDSIKGFGECIDGSPATLVSYIVEIMRLNGNHRFV